MPTLPPHPSEGLITALQRGIDEVLRPLLAGADRVALLDFPNHSNVGDSAIWLGETAYLRGVGIRPLCYTCDLATYCREHLAKRVGKGLILLQGGGNLGDLWEEHQLFREEVIQAFPENPIIQLPQSICFQERESLHRARAVFDQHPRLMLLLRDRQSLAIARNEFRAASQLCPDMAFCLGPLPRTSAARDRVIWLARSDQESIVPEAGYTTTGLVRRDWLYERPTALLRINASLSRRLRSNPVAWRWLRRSISLTYRGLARQRLRRGCQLLSAGKCVITDRLHGHILCVLLGVRHFLLDNSYRKLRSYYETWTHPCPFASWCDTPEEALVLATQEEDGVPPWEA